MADDPELHPLLRRQLRRVRANPDQPPSAEDWKELVRRVDRSYRAADQDRYIIERSLEISSQEMRELYARLERERDTMQAVLEAHSDGLCHLDADDRIRFINPAAEKMLGVRSTILPGTPISHLLRIAPEPAFFGSEWQAVLDQGEPILDDDCTFLLPDGSSFPGAYVINPIVKNGQLIGSVLGLRDLRTFKRTQRELEAARVRAEVATQAEKAKSEFMATMSHELRTPLNAVLGYSEMLMDEAEELGHTAFVPDLQRIHTSGEHLLSLINDVLDLSKIEAGHMELDHVIFQVGDVLREVLEVVAPMARENGNTLNATIAADLGVIRADPRRLRQILLNVLSNATKFTEDGEIEIAATRIVEADRPWLRVAVTDTGIGIRPEQIPTIFEAFRQVDASTTRRFGGTGLGLALTQKFLDMMGGRISVDSEVGLGSTFVVELPVRDDLANLATRPVLILERDPDVQARLARQLAREGVDTLPAWSVADALQLVSQLDVAGVLFSAELDGVWAAVGQWQERDDLRLFAMGGHDDDRHRSLEAGVRWLGTADSRRALQPVVGHDVPRGAILLVEDDRNIRGLLRRLLEKDGWRVEEAENGAAAVGCLTTRVPSLVVTDLMMPGMDGFELIEHLQADTRLQAVPIIAMTAMQLDRRDRRRLRNIPIIQKGMYSRDQLLREVRKQVGSVHEATG